MKIKISKFNNVELEKGFNSIFSQWEGNNFLEGRISTRLIHRECFVVGTKMFDTKRKYI